jgi:hypothetical protein
MPGISRSVPFGLRGLSPTWTSILKRTTKLLEAPRQGVRRLMLAFIGVRATVDWQAMDLARFLAQLHAPLLPGEMRALAETVALWDRTFSVGYFAFRHRLKGLAEANWAEMEEVAAVIKSPDLLHEIARISDHDYVILPVDDDDWFHPLAAKEAAAQAAGADSLSWLTGIRKHLSTEPPRVRINTDMFFTNSYAITRRGYRRMNEHEQHRIVQSHDDAGAMFLDGRHHNVFIPAAYGFTSKTLASLSFLRNMRRVTDGSLETILKARMRQGGVPVTLPEECRWAQKWSDEVAALHREAAGA